MGSFPGDARVELLTTEHDRAGFTCGVEALDRYLHRQAGQDAKRDTAVVYVLTSDSRTVLGYYTLSALSLDAGDLPAEIAKRLPRTAVPATLLGRLAVSVSLKGQGIGRRLLMDALYTAYRSSQLVASWAVIVDAKPEALEFYRKRGFLSLEDSPARLYLPMKTIAATVPESEG